VTVLLAACGNLFNLEHVNSTDLGKDDGGLDGPDGGANCYGVFLSICLDADVDDDWDITDGDINTGGSMNFDCEMTPSVDGMQLCVIAAKDIAITSRLTAHGGRPLVIVATNSLTLLPAVSLEVNSVVGGQRGAGANSNACPPNGPSDARFNGAGGGGAGGSFVGAGGPGGGGNADPTIAGAAVVTMPTPITKLRGGCKGGNGGGTTTTGSDSGGAIYLIAGAEMAILGSIDASGAGGRGPVAPNGGGGGGSGGMIVLDAPKLTISDTFLLARGGGGGGGGDGGGDGENGSQPIDDLVDHIGIGGAGGGLGAGPGGNGSSLNMPDGSGGTNGTGTFAGGGGGGGDGVIRVFSDMLYDATATYQPPKS